MASRGIQAAAGMGLRRGLSFALVPTSSNARPSPALIVVGHGRLLGGGGFVFGGGGQRRMASGTAGEGKPSPLRTAMRAASSVIMIPRLFPRVPEGFWQRYWPERQAEAAKVGLGAGVALIGYVPYSILSNVSGIFFHAVGWTTHTGSFLAGALGGSAAMTSVALAHKLISADPEEMRSKIMDSINHDWKLERALGGSVKPGAELAFTLKPASVGLEKNPAKSIRDEAYLACYKWNEASISVAFEVHGTAGSALVTSCGVKSFAGRYIIHTLDVEVNAGGEARRLVGDEAATPADPSLKSFVEGLGGGHIAELPRLSTQLSNHRLPLPF